MVQLLETRLRARADRAEEAALAAGLSAGDPAAATAFVRRFQGRVYGLALSITRDPALAEDVAQDVFVRAWKASRTYDPARASVATWLLTITRNVAIDAVRARRSIPTTAEGLEDLLQGTLGEPETAEAVANRLDCGRALHRLAEVQPEQARAVVLAVVGGCTAAEVSRHEDIPLGTAKTRIRTGLLRLRTLVDDAPARSSATTA